MNQILTLTLNPSIDKIIVTENLNIGYENRVSEKSHFHANGQGIRLSRALATLEESTHAVIALGSDPISTIYKHLLDKEEFTTTITQHSGTTRSDTVLVDIGQDTETHIIDSETVGVGEAVDDLVKVVTERCAESDILVCTGKIPQDTPHDFYATLIQVGHEADNEVVVMTSGDALQQALESSPDILIVIEHEAEALFNYPIRTVAQMKSSAQSFREYDCGRVLVVKNDFSRVLLLDQTEMWLAEIDLNLTGPPRLLKDALLAGYLVGLSQDQKPAQSLQMGMAALLYAADQPNNQTGSLAEIEPLLDQVQIKQLDITEDEAEALG